MDLVESMAELSYLGNLLGLPPVMDPMFPLAYGAFFGAVEVGMETEKEKEKESLEPKAIHTANVRLLTLLCCRCAGLLSVCSAVSGCRKLKLMVVISLPSI